MNFASFRCTNQSSKLPNGGESSKAVDGRTSTNSITHEDDEHPWWKVQLLRPLWVTHVEIAIRYIFKGM